MKKTLAVLMMLVLLAMLIVSCDGSADGPVIHKVTFDSDNGSEANVKEVIDGDKAPKPDDPVKTGYAFLGWYDGDTPFDFETSVKKNYYLKAKWQIQTFTVSFSANGGVGNYESQTINYGDKIDTTKVSNPTRTGHTFLGWYDGGEKFDIYNTPITSTITLTAKWDYMVTFDSDNGEAPTCVYLESAGTIAEGTVKNPEKKSFAFKGWYTNPEDETTKFEFGTTQVTADLTLTAKWKKTYTCIANYNYEGIKNDYYEVDDGYKFHFTDKDSDGYDWDITEPAKKYNENLNFVGWYYNGELYKPGTELWKNTEITVNEPVTLTAVWDETTKFYTVTFVDENDKELMTPEMVEAGKAVYIPTTPYKEGYTFVCWTKDGQEYDVTTAVKSDITLKAKWKINTYTVTFDSKGDTPATYTESVEYNKTVSKPADPKKYYGFYQEYDFLGWYNGSEKFDFGTPITKDITLTAKWGYTVTFNSNGGSAVDSVVVEQNGTVEKPADPTKEGQIFVGWYDGENKFNFDSAITKKTELTAKWRDPYTVTFNVEGNTTTIASKKDNGDGKVEAPTDKPTKAGWVFDHWSTEKNGTTAFDFDTVLSGNITLYAVFRNYYKVGDTGPAGGTIIYDCDADNNDGKNDGAGEDNLKSSVCGWRYLEAAPADVGTYTWGPNLNLGTGMGIGDGWKNMVKFMDEVGGLANFPAAEACDKYSVTVGGVTYDDWFLPSIEELWYITSNVHINGQYFSSSEFDYDVSKAWYRYRLDDGRFSSSFCSKSYSKSVRPVRAFLTWDKTNPPTLTNPTPQYTVTFNLNGGTGTVGTQTVKKGRTATKPATNPKKDGFIFDKWIKSDGTEYNFGDAVTGNITLYAKWTTPAVGVTVNLGTVSWKVLAVDNTNKRALLISENVLETCLFDSINLGDTFIKKYGLSDVDMCSVDVSGETTKVGEGNTKVFLLSKDEAGKYFSDNSARIARNGSWWLRSVYYESNLRYPYIVTEKGEVGTCNISWDNSPRGLRPAFWINLNM